MPIGQKFTFSTEIQLPSWVSEYANYPEWYTYSEFDSYIDVTDKEDGTATVSGLQETDYAQLFCQWGYLENSSDNWQDLYKVFYVHVEPHHIAIRYEGKDMYDKTIIIEPGETITLEADPCGVDVDNAQVTWSVASGDGVITINNQTGLSSSISGIGSGIATINLHVVAEGAEYDSQCRVFVKPAGDPKLSDYLDFHEVTLGYFPELATNTPKIRIPLNTTVENIPIAFIPKLPGFSFDCYLKDSFLDIDGDPWFNCFYDNTYDDIVVNCLYYDSYYRYYDGLVSTTLIMECEELGVCFSIPVEEYEYEFPESPAITIMVGDEVLTNNHLTLASGESITLRAVIGDYPVAVNNDTFDCNWWVKNDGGYWDSNSNSWISVPSSNLSYSSPEGRPLEVTVNGLEPGEDGLGFWYEVSYPGDVWNSWLYNDVMCEITVTDGASSSPDPSPTRKAAPKTRHSKKRPSQHKQGFDWNLLK